MATFFEHFTPKEVAKISGVGRRVHLPEGWSPIWKDTPADKAYIILDGKVSVRVDGNEIAQLGAGDIVGEAAIMGHKLRNATIVALTPLDMHPPHRRDAGQARQGDALLPPGAGGSRAVPRQALTSVAAPEQPADPAAAPTSGAGALDALEEHLLGERPTLTQSEVADQAGIPLETARELWHLLGFAHAEPEERAFTQGDVRALKFTQDLIDLGLLTRERQDGMVRTLGRSFARLAEWQVNLLAETALETGIDPTEGILGLADEVTPRVEELQTFIWRRHILNAASRMLAVADTGDRMSDRAVCFVDIVGYTSRSRTLTDRELVTWLESFETAALDTVVEHNGRIIKNIGDELLIVADTAEDGAAIAIELTRRGVRRGRRLPGGPRRRRLRRGRHPARRRVRAGRQHRGPADQRGAARHGPHRPRDVQRADRVLRGRRPRPRAGARRVAVPLPPAAPGVGEGVLTPPPLGAAAPRLTTLSTPAGSRTYGAPNPRLIRPARPRVEQRLWYVRTLSALMPIAGGPSPQSPLGMRALDDVA